MHRRARKILGSFLVFVVCYCVFLAVWLNVRTYYAHQMNRCAAHLAAGSLDATVKSVEPASPAREKITLTAPVVTARGIGDLLVEQTVDMDTYTFNVPLAAALLAASLVFMRWPWYALLEGLLIIAAGHMLYLYTYLMLNFQQAFANATAARVSTFRVIFWEFAWGFADNLVIRFEPFLVVVIIWLVFGKRRSDDR